MSRDPDWDERGRICRAQLDFARFLVGRWVGEGRSQGQEVTGELVVRDRFAHTFLTVEETLRDRDGGLFHEDAAFIRYDPKAEVVRVTHYMAHAWVSDQLLRPLQEGPGCLWYAGPFAPRVEMRPLGPDELEVRVLLPEEATPDTLMRYRRA